MVTAVVTGLVMALVMAVRRRILHLRQRGRSGSLAAVRATHEKRLPSGERYCTVCAGTGASTNAGATSQAATLT